MYSELTEDECKIVTEKLYEKFFGGTCQIDYNVSRMEYHIHIKNDDIYYIHFVLPLIDIKMYTTEQILNRISSEYLNNMISDLERMNK